MLALTGPDDGFDPVEDPPSSSRVQAAVPMYPHMAANMDRDFSMFPGTRQEFPGLYRDATPIHQVTRDDPPMLVLHGTADETTPVSHSERLAARLEEVGVPHELVIIDGAPHSFDLQPKQRDLRPLVIGFFDKYLKPAAAPRE